MTPAEVFSLRALWEAARLAARGKRQRPAVALFRLELEAHLVALHDELVSLRWRPSPPATHAIAAPKPRLITVQPFRDHVVHRCLFAVLGPRIERRLQAMVVAVERGELDPATLWASLRATFAHS